MTPAARQAEGAVQVEEHGRARQVVAGEFPLAVGGAAADIAVPGLDSGEPAAFLALDRGELFVQPRGGVSLSIAGTPVTASRWLRDGDELRLMGTRIRVAVGAEGLRLKVEHAGLDRPTDPPALAPSVAPDEAAAEPELIRPVAFQPRPIVAGPARRPPRGPRLLAPATGILLLAGAAFVLAARAVEVRVEPEPERLSVWGWPHLPLGDTRLILPGRYALVAERAGYRRLETEVEVTGQRRQVVRIALEPLPGLLAVEPTPARGVRVFVGGTERGTTPLGPLELPAGRHEVALRAEGFAPFTASVDIAGRGRTQTLTARLVPDRAAVSFASEPAGASVRVDGAEVGRTPLTVDLTSGRRTVEVALAGYANASRRIEVVAERPQQVPRFRLALLPGRLSLTSDPPGAAVSVDGAFRGQTPLVMELPSRRSHTLRLSRAGHQPAQDQVALDPGEARDLSLTLAPIVGEVEVLAEPADAELWVDGQARGRVGQVLRLTAAPHELEVRRQGHETHKATVTPRESYRQTVRVRLRSLREAREATRPRSLETPGGHVLRLLSPGRFVMGASRREPGRRANETLREVELARPSYLAAHEVTNAQFRRFRPSHSSGRIGAYRLDDDHQPVVNLTWEDAALYCNWLSAREGLPPAYVTRDGKTVAAQPLTTGYRLPTEAEWSRAARYPGRGPLKYAWGDALPVPPGAGNYADESARPLVTAIAQGYDDRHPASAPVGSFKPNALGLFDLGGNAAEWVHDGYALSPPDPKVERDPTGPPAADLHVILGASFLQGTVTELRLSYRDYGTKPRPDVGFRVARYAE